MEIGISSSRLRALAASTPIAAYSSPANSYADSIFRETPFMELPPALLRAQQLLMVRAATRYSELQQPAHRLTRRRIKCGPLAIGIQGRACYLLLHSPQPRIGCGLCRSSP